MLRLKAASYAVAAMVDLARHPSNEGRTGEVCASNIAARYGLPLSYTAKILSHLAKASLLKSGRGPHGGFSLAIPATEVTLLDIFQAVGALSHGEVELSSRIPSSVQTNLDGIMGRAMGQVEYVLSEATLADLMAGVPALGVSVADKPDAVLT